MDFLNIAALELETIMPLLSEAAQSSLGEKLIVVAIIWFVMKGKVASHFGNINRGLMTIGTSLIALEKKIELLTKSLVDLETSHTQKFNDLSDRVEKLESNQNNSKE